MNELIRLHFFTVSNSPLNTYTLFEYFYDCVPIWVSYHYVAHYDSTVSMWYELELLSWSGESYTVSYDSHSMRGYNLDDYEDRRRHLEGTAVFKDAKWGHMDNKFKIYFYRNSF